MEDNVLHNNLFNNHVARVVVILATFFLIAGCGGDDDGNPADPGNGNGNGGGNLFTPGAGVVDADGNTYPTVILAGQEWMAANLRSSKLSDGTPIENATGTWGDVTWPVWIHYGYDAVHDATHGKVYNGHAATHPLICPDGWRVPTLTDLQALITHLGGEDAAGGKMKQAGTASWQAPNTGADNKSGLNALASGYRVGNDLPPDGGFGDMGLAMVWWSSTPGGGGPFPADDYLHGVSLAYNRVSAVVSNLLFMKSGYCIRCLRDAE